MRPAPFGYSLLQTPADAVMSWLGGVAPHGQGFHGIIFTLSDRDADCYLRASEKVMPKTAIRHRNFSGPVSYEIAGSNLYLEILRRPNDHLGYVAAKHFICFDNPAAWTDPKAIVTLVARLSLQSGSHVVSVGSHIAAPDDPATNSGNPVIDYSAITRAVSN